jgi:hypothetical protein
LAQPGIDILPLPFVLIVHDRYVVTVVAIVVRHKKR